MPTSRVTDSLQVVAASALPAIANFAGVELSSSAEGNVFAYIGLAALSLFGIRFLWAPYSIWKAQTETIGELERELANPERMVLERLAKYRAKDIMKLVEIAHDISMSTYRDDDERDLLISNQFNKAHRLSSRIGLPDKFVTCLSRFSAVCRKGRENKKDWPHLDARDHIISFLQKKITIEQLLDQLPEIAE